LWLVNLPGTTQGEIMHKLIIACLFLTLPLLVFADEGSKRKNIEDLLILTNAKSSIDTIYSQMDEMLQRIAEQVGKNPKDKEIFKKYNAKIIEAMKKEVNWQKMKEHMVNIYMKHYTEKEINDMLAFYKSETGRSMVRKTPEVMKDTMLASQSMIKGFAPKMSELMQEMRKELDAAKQSGKK
jgi:hypothetical protein